MRKRGTLKNSPGAQKEGERQETAGEVGCPDYVGLCSPWGDGVRGGLSSAIKWQLKGASLLFIVQQPELITWCYPATSEALRQKERTSGCGWALVLSTTQIEISFMSPGPVHPTTFSISTWMFHRHPELTVQKQTRYLRPILHPLLPYSVRQCRTLGVIPSPLSSLSSSQLINEYIHHSPALPPLTMALASDRIISVSLELCNTKAPSAWPLTSCSYSLLPEPKCDHATSAVSPLPLGSSIT